MKQEMTINQLDPSQKYALRQLIAAADDDEIDLSLVFGPPGTGKSQLLVSLLYELAVRSKKVLFVSQNTEALEVIERMASHVERDMGLTGNYLSLSDFCLKLYTREQRYLKYITAQSSRLTGKLIPPIDVSDEPANPASSIPLGYVHLDRAANYAMISEDLGVDELLRYLLQYVSGDLVIETLYQFDKINARAVLRLIDEYPFRDDFSFYNQPQNELRFISTTNPDINLNIVQSGVRDIGGLVSQLTPSLPQALVKQPIDEYLAAVAGYATISQRLNAYRIQVDHLELDDMEESLRLAAIKSSTLLSPQDVVSGLELVKAPIFQDARQVAFLGADRIAQYTEHLQELHKIAAQFHKADKDLITFEIRELLFNIIESVGVDLSPVLEKFPSVKEWNRQTILQELQDAEEFSHKNAIERRLKGAPDSFKTYLPESKNGDYRILLEFRPYLITVAQILEKTHLRVATYDALYQKAKTPKKRAINPFDGIEDATALALANKLMRTIELTKTYGLDRVATFRELQTEVDTLLRDLGVYSTTLQTNRDKAMRLDTKQLVDLINATIQHNMSKATISEVYSKMGRYLADGVALDAFTRDADDYARFVNTHKSITQKVCDSLTLMPDPSEIQPDSINDLISTLSSARQQDIYSDFFFTIAEGHNPTLWYDTVKNVNHFSNNHQLDAYIAHNKFVSALIADMPGNEGWLRSLLKEPSISFYDFAGRVVNSVVRTKFNNLPPSQRKSIKAGFFKEYANSLKTERKAYYIDGLKKLRQETYATARTISNGNNWVLAPSTMEKIRKNTKLITDVYPIIIATPKEVAKYIAPEKELFDYVVFDEASQLLPGQALPAIFRAKETVIIGDPHQMPPTLTATVGSFNNEADLDEEDISDSILDLAKKMQPQGQYHLKVHYRSESNKLFEPSRKAIYEKDNINPIYEAHLYDAAPIDIVDSLGHGMDESGKYDKNFGEIVTRMNDYLQRESGASFCILFTTSIDANSFREYLTVYEDTLGEISKLYAENKILISTVTNCQGIEGTFSILYMPHYDRPGAMWFFREGAGAYKRLNVAITRQRKGLTLLLADSRQHWLQACDIADNPNTTPNKKLSAALLRSLLQNAGEVVDTEYLDRTLADNALAFDSPLTEQLYNRLQEHYRQRLNIDLKIYCEVGWHMLIPSIEGIDKNNRNVGFRIDLGIYSMAQKKFILGIEMDGAAYHTGYDREHSDYERQKILEDKGWEIYRIWSTNWLNDQASEFQRLVSKIDDSLNASDREM